MRQPHLYSAVFAVIKNENSKFLCLQRQNTGYYDGWRSLPAWHLESDEWPTGALLHEMEEELGIVPTEYRMIHTLHKMCENRHYYDLAFLVTKREWEILNKEPHVCSALGRFSFDSLPEYMTEEAKRFLEAYHDNRIFSEMDLRT